MERREDKTARGSKKNKGKQKYIATEDMFLHDNKIFWKKTEKRKKSSTHLHKHHEVLITALWVPTYQL